MAEPIYQKDEYLKKTGLKAELFDALLVGGVLRPAGRVDGETPYFDEHGVAEAEAIVKLLDIGYTVEEVIRIRRKVGLPKKREKRAGRGKPLLTVGALAKRIGSNGRTIKHWEEKGIIEPDSYSPGGYRMYSEAYVALCRLIQDLQLFGYSLDEIKGMADLFRDYLAIRSHSDEYTPEAIIEKARLMKEKIAELKGKMALFEQGIERWRGLLKQKQRELSSLTAKTRKLRQKNEKEAPRADDAPDTVQDPLNIEEAKGTS